MRLRRRPHIKTTLSQRLAFVLPFQTPISFEQTPVAGRVRSRYKQCHQLHPLFTRVTTQQIQHLLRRWANIKPVLVQGAVFAG